MLRREHDAKRKKHIVLTYTFLVVDIPLSEGQEASKYVKTK